MAQNTNIFTPEIMTLDPTCSITPLDLLWPPSLFEGASLHRRQADENWPEGRQVGQGAHAREQRAHSGAARLELAQGHHLQQDRRLGAEG